MSIQEINTLDNQCNKIVTSIEDSVNWVNDYKIVPTDNKKALSNILNKYRRDTIRYQNALHKRPSIAIFGQSQVGKSYLVSNLAKKNEDPSLKVKIPGTTEEVNFIERMNPPGGGKEATGLVSRFTIKDDHQTGQKPYLLKLFSQSDLVKIIANGYLSDLKPYIYQVNPDEVKLAIEQANTKKRPSLQPGFTLDDVWSLNEYFEHNFSSHVIITKLKELDFWERIVNVIPFLDASDRFEILSLLWGKQPFFTDLFQKCTDALKQINFLTSVRCDLDALAPNTSTLLDVQRLREMFGDGSEKPPVDLYDNQNKIATIHRSIVSAITAEVVLPLPENIVEDKDREFLKESDILDFPGARSRNIIPETTFVENGNIEKLEVFLRGKVAFLFDRYNYNFEISTLMFCMHDDQPEVQDIPRLLYDWISTNHGASQAEREQREQKLATLVPNAGVERIIPLLVVQTKFNIDLKGNPATEKLGQSETHDWKWNARLDANFNKFMIKPVVDKWPDTWNQSDGSFKNVFLLRDPKWSYDVFDGYTEDSPHETGINEKYVQKLEDMKESFLAHTYVNKHFRNPNSAWDESCVPGKSGINYIVKYLTPTCNPIIRLDRLKGLIQEQKQNVLDEFINYVDSGDLASKLRKARLNGGKAFMFLTNWVKRTSAFGDLLDRLTIEESEAWGIYWNFRSSIPANGNGNGKPKKEDNSDQLVTLREFFNAYGVEFEESKSVEENLYKLKSLLGIEHDEDFEEILASSGIDMKKVVSGIGDGPVKSEAELFTENLIDAWMLKVLQVKNDSTLVQKGLNKEVSNLISEALDKSKERVGLKKIISNNVHSEIENFSVNSNYNIVADISAKLLNDYVNTVGWKFVDSKGENYPKIQNVPIFSQESTKTPKLHELDLTLEYPGMVLFNQWVWGLKEAFIANVMFEEKLGNPEDALIKQKLAQILQKMD